MCPINNCKMYRQRCKEVYIPRERMAHAFSTVLCAGLRVYQEKYTMSTQNSQCNKQAIRNCRITSLTKANTVDYGRAGEDHPIVISTVTGL